MIAMDTNETRALIVAAGGDKAFAKLLGIDSKKGYQQRVNNWKRRGMPDRIELQHMATIRQLQRKASAQA